MLYCIAVIFINNNRLFSSDNHIMHFSVFDYVGLCTVAQPNQCLFEEVSLRSEKL